MGDFILTCLTELPTTINKTTPEGIWFWRMVLIQLRQFKGLVGSMARCIKAVFCCSCWHKTLRRHFIVIFFSFNLSHICIYLSIHLLILQKYWWWKWPSICDIHTYIFHVFFILFIQESRFTCQRKSPLNNIGARWVSLSTICKCFSAYHGCKKWWFELL